MQENLVGLTTTGLMSMRMVKELIMAMEKGVKHIMVGLGSIRRLRMLAMYTAGE